MYNGIRKAFSLLFFLLAVWLGIQFLLPLLFPFLLGGALALAAEPMVAFLCRSLRLRRGAAAGIGVTAAFCLIVLLLMLLCALIVRELGVLVSILPSLEQAAAGGIAALSGWAMELVARLPGGLRDLLSPGVTEFFSGSSQLLSQAFRYVVGLTGGVLSQVPDGALVLGTAIISSYMLSAKLPKLRDWIREKVSRERIRKYLESLHRVKAVLGGWLKAQVKLMGLTWVILTLALVLLRIPYAPLWATAVALVDAFPILGTGTVLLPWALVCFLQEDTVRAVGLLGTYAVISLTRSVMEPRLLGSHLGLDPLLTLAALYAGYRLWGFGGMILAPVLAVALVQLLRDPETNP